MQIYGIETRRYYTPEYFKLSDELIPRIQKLFNTEVYLVKAYNKKESHGDMDILVLNSGNLGNIRGKLADEFPGTPIHCNGNVYSIEYKEFQIDIIPQPVSNWETAKCFFDFDPTGNLMGKIAHKFGLKYGFQGLVYPFRNCDGRLTTDITISRDNRKIFEFLGLDYDRYLQTFDTVEEIFEYIIGSKYFNGDGFMMEELNHIDKKRNKKRATYQGFITYINKNKPVNKFEFSKDKSDYLHLIDEFFPEAGFLTKLAELKKIDGENQSIKEKFNGNLVMEWTGLSGKELGLVLEKYKSQFGETYRHFMLKSTDDFIKGHFMKWYENARVL